MLRAFFYVLAFSQFVGQILAHPSEGWESFWNVIILKLFAIVWKYRTMQKKMQNAYKCVSWTVVVVVVVVVLRKCSAWDIHTNYTELESRD